jgi:hypothetical protein
MSGWRLSTDSVAWTLVRGGERALAIGRRAAEAGEHVVEARRQRAQLRGAVAGNALVEVLGARDVRGRRAQAAQRTQQDVGDDPHPDARHEQGADAERREPPVERREAVLEAAQARRHLEPREAAELGLLEADDVGAVALAADGERAQAVARRGRAGGSLAGLDEHAPPEQEAQRRRGGRQHLVEAAVVGRQLALDGCERRLARQLGGRPQAVVERGALGAVDVARDHDAGGREHDGDHDGDAEREATAEAAHALRVSG